ncbi:Cell division protein ZapD [hydrothermal vent metagenome]|uniref:Cell division protein ZapD n=1 Tax=hydrothermal vent metagenome TaxID=652676 RepID=A0A3B0ZS67_9ZZZZ
MPLQAPPHHHWVIFVQKMVYYEQPLNERVRTLLRLELLFQQSDHFLAGHTCWDSRGALSALIDILEVLNRADLKTEYIKEMERQSNALARLNKQPGVDEKQLDTILQQLERYSDQLLGISGVLGQELRQNELINTIKQRSTIAGGTCDFDLPMLHHWLERAVENRQYDLKTWHQLLRPVRYANDLLIKLIRESTSPQHKMADKGFFQQALDSNHHYQMIRIGVDSNDNAFPEVSGGRHRFTIRFMTASITSRPQQVSKDVNFQLTLSGL